METHKPQPKDKTEWGTGNEVLGGTPKEKKSERHDCILESQLYFRVK